MCLHVKFTLMSDTSDCTTFLHFAVQLPKNLIQEDVSPSCPWFLGRVVWHMKRCHWRHRFGSWKWPYIVASLHTPCVGKIGLECGDFEGWQAHSMGGGMLGQLEEGGCSTITRQTRSLFQASEEQQTAEFSLITDTRTWAGLIALWNLWNHSHQESYGVREPLLAFQCGCL